MPRSVKLGLLNWGRTVVPTCSPSRYRLAISVSSDHVHATWCHWPVVKALVSDAMTAVSQFPVQNAASRAPDWSTLTWNMPSVQRTAVVSSFKVSARTQADMDMALVDLG